MLRSRAKASFWTGQHLVGLRGGGMGWAYSYGGKYVGIHFEGFLVDARGQCRVQALGQAQCDCVAMWDDWCFGWVRLESLQDAHVSHAHIH
jgi:hypothetical protein